MIQQTPQLILALEPPVGPRDPKVVLRVYHSEEDYFNAKREPAPEYKVELPHPFKETALMDPGGWRKKPRAMGPSQELGQRMWENLPETVRNEALAGSPNKPQRVAILSTATGIDDVPWEWLNDPSGLRIAATDSVRFVRLSPSLYATPPLTVVQPVRVLIVLTNPKDERLLRGDIEVDTVSRGLMNNPDYEIKQLLEPRLDALKRELEWSPNIIHYIGHAGISRTKGNLILHDEHDGTHWLSANQISRYIPSSVRLLCLSTCVTAENYQIGGLSKFAHCPSEVSLPTTIVNQYALEQAEAATFWSRFYPAMIRHEGNVVEAFHKARMAVHDANPDSCGWASFSLVVRDGIGHPLRISGKAEHKGRVDAEIKAQWATRLANNLATRMPSLGDDAADHFEKSIADETARVEDLEREIDKY